jgi:hypothetical protein
MDEITLLRGVRDELSGPTDDALGRGRAALLAAATADRPLVPRGLRRLGQRQRWSALGIAAIVVFGGGLVTGAASARTTPVTPEGLFKVDCASGASPNTATTDPNTPRQSINYFDIATRSLVARPSEVATADFQKNPSIACGSEIPRVIAAIGLALPGYAKSGDHCGTITVPGYPTAYFLATDTDAAIASGSTSRPVFAINMVSSAPFAYAGPVATVGCVNLTLTAPADFDPKMVTCEAARNVAMVYLDTKAVGADAVCEQHGYPVWNG